jgi:hypothetical protein
MCHRASESTAGRCQCGYEFGQDIDTVRRLLRRQLRSSVAASAALVIGNLGLVALAAVSHTVIPLLGWYPLLRLTARSMRTIAVSRESLRQLAPRQLPPARLLTD